MGQSGGESLCLLSLLSPSFLLRVQNSVKETKPCPPVTPAYLPATFIVSTQQAFRGMPAEDPGTDGFRSPALMMT